MDDEYGWMVYCFDEEELLIVECVYKTEYAARGFVKETPYFCVSDDVNDRIKYKIKKIHIR